ncbi:MAG: hypothetical protein ACRC67_13880 [Inquilinus sp.]|uniref:hypothetical protein n=1 Tax=Inquilinus sp. TaxID=1932117 RepID=UPI003F367CF3
MRLAIMASLALAALTGCASYFSVTSLEPDGSGGYRFKAPATSYEWPLDDPRWEAERRAMLQRRLQMSGACPTGYRVTDRQPVLAEQTTLGDVWFVTYFIRCNA